MIPGLFRILHKACVVPCSQDSHLFLPASMLWQGPCITMTSKSKWPGLAAFATMSLLLCSWRENRPLLFLNADICFLVVAAGSVQTRISCISSMVLYALLCWYELFKMFPSKNGFLSRLSSVWKERYHGKHGWEQGWAHNRDMWWLETGEPQWLTRPSRWVFCRVFQGPGRLCTA